MKFVNNGSNAVDIKRGMDEAVKEVVEGLKSISLDISSQEQLKQVATISSNNDDEVGILISTAMEKVGREGVVTIEESKTGETTLEIVEGLQFDRGYKSPYFVTNNDNMSALLEEPKILIYNGKLTQVKEMLPLLERVSQMAKPLLIIAEDIEGEALATLIVNKMRGTLKVCAVKAPDFGDRRTQILEDIAILTGGSVVSFDKGMKLDKFDLNWLGSSRLVTVYKDITTIVDGKGDEDKINERIEELKKQVDSNKSPYESERLQERLAKLVGGVAIISVGANTELELKEKKDRVDDALHATQAAIEEGILPGGGTALLFAREFITYDKSKLKGDMEIGKQIVYKACGSPFHKILSNAGYDDSRIYSIQNQIGEKGEVGTKPWFGFDLRSETVLNTKDAGIIDPTKVVRSAIQNASSVAGTLLLTDACIFNEKEEGEEVSGFNPMQGMM